MSTTGALPTVAAAPAAAADLGTVQEFVTAPTSVGNVASATSPEALKTGTHTGSRDATIAVLKKRASWIAGVLALSNLGVPLSAEFRARLQNGLGQIMPALKKQVAIDWLANIAFAAGARPELIAKLDSATVVEVADSELDSEAAYDEHENVIRIRSSLVQEIEGEVESLARQNVIDRLSGMIVDPTKLKGTEEYRSMVLAQALIGAHELMHGEQAAEGHTDAASSALQPLVSAFLAGGGGDIEAQLVREYVSQFEYEAYAAQERYQWEMGVAPRTVQWMTIDNSGQPIDKAQAVENLVRFLTDKGFSGNTVVSIVGSQAAHGGRIPGDEVPGGRIPGGRIPGDMVPGGRIPGDMLPGGRIPGDMLPGGRIPGDMLPGGRIPGDEIPGGRIPGGRIPGDEIPGGRIPGDEIPGGRIPGGRIPGDEIPGGRIPGDEIPGGRIPGDEIPGGRIPGDEIPGGRIPGGRIPGFVLEETPLYTTW